jgi:hypothetical protein
MSNFLDKPQQYYSDGTSQRFPNGKSHQNHVVALSMPTKLRDDKYFKYQPATDEREFKINVFDADGNEIWYEQHYNHGCTSYKSSHPKEYNDPDITTKIILDEQENVPMTEYILTFGWSHEKETFVKLFLLMGGKIVE